MKPAKRKTGSVGVAFRRFVQDLRLNDARSPWCRAQGMAGWVENLRGEIKEFADEIAAGTRAARNAELGDIFQNCIELAQANERAGGAPLATILTNARAKLQRRKPWIFDPTMEQPQTPEEEHAWYTARKRQIRARERKANR